MFLGANDLRYYIVDDDKNIIKVLANIIEDKELGEVIGSSEDSDVALKEILMLSPDIVLIDLLMPKLDGNSLVREVKSIKPRINFIMISQVSDRELVADSYNSGIEFFIGKPINIIEVEKVIKKVGEKLQLENMLSDIQKVFKSIPVQKDTGRENIKEIKYILSMLGMLGEKGTNDIFKMCIFLMENNRSYDDCHIDYICDHLGDNPKTVKQRMRRAVKSGLTNLANLGLEDYSNESFQNYSNVLFDFENVKAEMDYIRGKKRKGGKVSINKFIEGLMMLCERA